CGIDIGTQQQNPATQMIACTTFGRSPRTRLALVGVRTALAPAPCEPGAGRRNRAATGTTPSSKTPANPRYVTRQPGPAINRSNTAGHITPAMYWPEEIKAIAVPRR